METLDATVDNFTKHYENIENDMRKSSPSQVKWDADKSTIYVKYDVKGAGMQTKNWYFTSNYASDYLWGPKYYFG